MGYKVYISGPMTGKDYKNRFAMAEVALEQGGNVAINPVKIANQAMGSEPYKKETQPFLDACDAVLMLAGWQNIVECNAEFARAMENKMIIAFEGGRGCQSPNKPEPGISQKKPEKKFIKGIKGAFSALGAIILRRK